MPARRTPSSSSATSRRKVAIGGLAAFLVVAVALAIGLGIGLGGNRESGSSTKPSDQLSVRPSTDPSPSLTPTHQPSIAPSSMPSDPTSVCAIPLMANASLSAAPWIQVGGDFGRALEGSSMRFYVAGNCHLSRNGHRVAIRIQSVVFYNAYTQVYEQQNGGNWTTVGPIIVGDSFAQRDMKLNSDGTRLIVGNPSPPYYVTNDPDLPFIPYRQQGIVRVREWNGTEWAQIGQILLGAGEYANFGVSVSIDDSGSRIAVGARALHPKYLSYSLVEPHHFGGNVTVYDYDEANDVWNQVGPVLNDQTGKVYYFGDRVELSGDGTRLEVGFLAVIEGYDDLYRSTSRIYELNIAENTWTELGTESLAAYNVIDSGSLSSDGSIFAAGSRFHYVESNVSAGMFESGIGRARVLHYNEGSDRWEQMGHEILGDAVFDQFGRVSLSSSGCHLAVGGTQPFFNRTGHVRVYYYIDGSWEKKGHDLVGDDGYDEFGFSVVISGDGSRVAVGNGDYPYYVRVYENPL